MRTFSTKDVARTMRKLYDTKALLTVVDNKMHPVADDNLEAKAQLCEREAEAMAKAEEALAFMDRVLQNLMGSDVWPQAMRIAYAPIEYGGYERVAEYYRRTEAIQKL